MIACKTSQPTYKAAMGGRTTYTMNTGPPKRHTSRNSHRLRLDLGVIAIPPGGLSTCLSMLEPACVVQLCSRRYSMTPGMSSLHHRTCSGLEALPL